MVPGAAHILPATPTLLVSGGDTRIALDPVSGRSIYGCRPWPESDLVALGSSTASVISEAGFAAAEALRATCVDQLRQQAPADVYALHTERLRSDLLAECGFSRSDGMHAVLAASGTDLHLLAAQWLRPQRTVLVAPMETGSGVPAALQGQHFNRRVAGGVAAVIGTRISDWHCDLTTLAARTPDGALRAGASVDAECMARVNAAAEAGQQVLLILTDVSKTGLIVPSVETALALKRRWPEQVEVLVDACQFRLSQQTVQAYLARGCMLAVTGSKFMAGPTFCAALIIPPVVAARYRDNAIGRGACAYSNAADWPAGWLSGLSLPATTNFGLLLRWQAALTELHPFFALPEPQIVAFLQSFGQVVRERLARGPCFEALPVAPLQRVALGIKNGWDTEQTIFPFLLRTPAGMFLSRDQTESVYQALRKPITGSRRFQLGQPVACGVRDGVPVSGLRLCVSAPMIVVACRPGGADAVLADALAALDRIADILTTAKIR